ncbi:hypothetical protein ACH5RR_034091 [Cinchona calisaya]|uniref:Uncharacterized protein n=1 Tax=Cinchona calisaya TaxID=153742 RepID=A0ABD2YEH6_9GENT
MNTNKLNNKQTSQHRCLILHHIRIVVRVGLWRVIAFCDEKRYRRDSVKSWEPRRRLYMSNSEFQGLCCGFLMKETESGWRGRLLGQRGGDLWRGKRLVGGSRRGVSPWEEKSGRRASLGDDLLGEKYTITGPMIKERKLENGGSKKKECEKTLTCANVRNPVISR